MGGGAPPSVERDFDIDSLFEVKAGNIIQHKTDIDIDKDKDKVLASACTCAGKPKSILVSSHQMEVSEMAGRTNIRPAYSSRNHVVMSRPQQQCLICSSSAEEQCRAFSMADALRAQ